jgi:putative transposase
MPKIPRLVIPDVPHHVTQRGVRRMQVFFLEEDYAWYRRCLRANAERHGVSLWAYCLMPNHVHLVATPSDEHGLARALAETHCAYARRVNELYGWRGHLWQERFWSFPLDEPYLRAVARYVLLNPVRAGLVRTAVAWSPSSARAHLGLAEDELVDCAPLAQRIEDWHSLLEEPLAEALYRKLRLHSSTGRPLGEPVFVAEIERRTGRDLTVRRRGRKPRASPRM